MIALTIFSVLLVSLLVYLVPAPKFDEGEVPTEVESEE